MKTTNEDCLSQSRTHGSDHLSTRQYARIVKAWVTNIGLDPAMYGTHTLRRTKVSLIYRRTKNLRAVQLLLGHMKLESTVRYLGIEVDDAPVNLNLPGFSLSRRRRITPPSLRSNPRSEQRLMFAALLGR